MFKNPFHLLPLRRTLPSRPGFLLYGLNTLAQWIFPVSVSAAITLFAWVILTRAFHLDGFMDMCDGLFGGFNPERRLEIMKDSRMGAFGVAGGILVLLTESAASHEVSPAINVATRTS